MNAFFYNVKAQSTREINAGTWTSEEYREDSHFWGRIIFGTVFLVAIEFIVGQLCSKGGV